MSILNWLRRGSDSPAPKPYPHQFRAKVVVKYKGIVLKKYEMSLHAKNKKHARDTMVADIQQNLTYGVEIYAG